jgi:hypothetical protein
MKLRAEHAATLGLALLAVLPAAADPPAAPSPAAHVPSAPAAAAARYAGALQAELVAMRREPTCVPEARARFHCTFAGETADSGTMHAVYSDETDTVYVYLERYAMLSPDDAHTPTLLRRMMELNWQLLVGKLEWSARSGEVRLSAVLNTDSNFDRRALRSIVLALDAAANRHRGELGGRQ